MSYQQFKANSNIIFSLIDQLTGYVNIPGLIFAFPRPDYSTDIFRFEPNFYILRPIVSPKVKYSMSATRYPIISSLNRQKNYANYNLYSTPDSVSCSEAIIQSLRDTALASILDSFGFSSSLLQVQANSVVFQIKDRIKSATPFTIWGSQIGTYELGYFSNFEPDFPKLINQVRVNFTFDEVRTFGSTTRWDEI